LENILGAGGSLFHGLSISQFVRIATLIGDRMAVLATLTSLPTF